MNEAADQLELDTFLDRPAPSWWTRRGKWAAIVVGIVLLALLLTRCFGGSAKADYQTGEVTRGDLSVTVSATGNLAPTNQIDVGSEISGIVERVRAEVNDRVAKGQPLAEIDTSRLDDAVTQSRAALASNLASVGQARATLDEAQAQLARFREVSRLSGGRVPAKSELSSQAAAVARAVSALRSAQANVVSAQAQLSSNQTQVNKALIRSPVSGVVLKRSVDQGQTVQASFNTPSLFIIAEDLTRMKLEVAVDEADVGQVREGQPASFTVDAYPGRSFPATITRVNLGAKNLVGSSSSTTTTASTSNVVSYVANLTLSNADLILRPGMTATATIQTAGEKNALLVPNAALRFTPPTDTAAQKKTGISIRPPDARQARKPQVRGIGAGSRQTVYVREDDNSLRAVSVVTGRTNGRVTAVTGDLKTGDKVVTGVKAAASGS